MSAFLILCFVRDKSAASAMATLDQALPFRDQIVAVLDSAEHGHPGSRLSQLASRASPLVTACSTNQLVEVAEPVVQLWRLSEMRT
jgi:hypothetical protein